ncbi:MAG: DUF1697 domain-containing protein [Carnobacterium sp.]|uniref:DUF1697 domain-containing protein n=1 Tax=Carnobacterium sp. TaxID=48221 RepID=UPI002FCBEC38
MKKQIALLRGINVGGKNKIAMADLKEAFETWGFSEVKTYINSGNVLFSSDIEEKTALVQSCQALLKDQFGLTIPVMVLSVDELTKTVEHAPIWWNQATERIYYAIFVIPPMTVAEVYQAVGEIDPVYEQMADYGDVIFWSAAQQTFSKSRWAKIASSAVNKQVTIRNGKTVNKLLLLGRG